MVDEAKDDPRPTPEAFLRAILTISPKDAKDVRETADTKADRKSA